MSEFRSTPQTSEVVEDQPKDTNNTRSIKDPIGNLGDYLNDVTGELPDSEADEPASAGSSTEEKQNKWEALLNQSEIKPTDYIERPPICLSHETYVPGESIVKSVIGTLGNFLVITGKAKSRKTFVVSIFVAALLSEKLILKCFRGHLPDDKKTVLYFDSEQGRWHVQRVLKRICELCGDDNPPNLKMYSLRPYATYDRLEVIRWAIKNTPNVGAVIIDGVRDTVFDINDAEEATNRATDLLQWTDEKQIHLITVLHENKNDRNARGHLGTELGNKCETMLSVQRDQKDKEVSIITPEMCRDREFPETQFSIDEYGMPFLIDDTNIGNFPGLTEEENGRRSKPTPLTVNRENHEAILRKAFAEGKPLSYQDLRVQIRLGAEYLGIDISDRRFVDFVTWYRNEGYVKTHKPEGEKYPINELNLDRLNDSQPLQS